MRQLGFLGGFISAAALACSVSLGPYGVIAQAPDPVPLDPVEVSTDTTAPSGVTVSEVHLTWVDHGEVPAKACPDVDSLSFVVEGRDDVSALDVLRVAAFIAADEAAVQAKADADVLFKFNPVSGRNVGVVLGLAKEHERTGAGFSRVEPYCFAIALLDEAGNLSEKSNVSCVNTMDPDAPYATRIDAAKGCGCEGASGTSVIALLAVARMLRRRAGER